MVPAGTIHTAWNAGSGDEQVHVLVDLRLGGVRSETPLETMFGLAHDGKTTKAGDSQEPAAAGPPRARLRGRDVPRPATALGSKDDLWGLAKVGRLLGYRAEYPYPYSDQGEGPLRSEGEPVSAISGARTGAVVVGTILIFLVPFLLRRRRRSRR